MDVRVAGGALIAYVREHHLDVAPGTGHALVHPPERELRLIVVKFRDGPNRLPAVYGVAILAGEVKSAVRTVRA